MKRVKHIALNVPMEMWFELIDAAAECYQKDERRDCTPESFALEAIQSVLADRRLNRMELAG
ncbi:MAG TPA: hypothetical protein VGM18_04980 [Candidatus Sulfotelmatobacter sp.]|jgi:hypothetical protein